MKFLITISSFLVICMANPDTNIENTNPEESDYMSTEFKYFDNANSFLRIFGGAIATPNAFTYACGMSLSLSGGRRTWCGGSVISERFVLTAAHCLDNVLQARIIFGAHDQTNNVEHGRVTRIARSTNFIVHSGWNAKAMINDIALVELTNPIQFTDKIQPVALPSRSEEQTTFDGAQATISGWGHFDMSGTISRYLRYANVRIMGNQMCRSYFPNNVRPSNICVDGSKGQGTCHGDSGGPLVTKSNKAGGKTIIIGLTSFGTAQGCNKGWPTVFTRITSHLDWISARTGIRIA